MDTPVALLVALVMAVGLVGTVVPLVPGLGLVWLAALGYGLAEGFGPVGLAAMAVVTALGVAGTAAGLVLPHRAARGAGAARGSMLLGLIGAIVGFFAIPVVGFALGGTGGVYLGELGRLHDPGAAWRATWATIVGFGVATLAQLAFGLLMVACWAGWALLG